MLAATPPHQSSGCCSDHRGRGVDSERGVVALLTTSPARFMRSALAPVVEMSIPRKRLIARQEEYPSSIDPDVHNAARLRQAVRDRSCAIEALQRFPYCTVQ